MAHRNALNWFEILGSELGVFSDDEPGVGGALMAGPQAAAPSASGTLVYLNVNPSLDAALARALAAGGQLLVPRVDLPGGMGSFVHVLDVEGNRIGLHAQA